MKFLFLLLILIANQAYGDNRIKIGIIDSGLSQEQYSSKFTCGAMATNDITPIDSNGHGTNIYSLVSKDLSPDKYCIISYRISNKDGMFNVDSVTTAINLAIRDKVKYINLSIAGNDPNYWEFSSLARAVSKGIKVAVAAGNNYLDLNEGCTIYPACYRKSIKKNYYVIGNYDSKNKKIVDSSNRGSIVYKYIDGNKVGLPLRSGTSQATAIFLNKLIKGEFK